MFTIGIDLGGTNIVAAVVDEKYNIIAKAKTPTAVPRSAELIFDDIAKVCKEAVEKAGLTMNDISSIGLGTPGTVNSDGVIEFANNLNFDNVPAKDMIIERLGDKPVYVANDANCAALGEAYAGCGNGAKNFIAVTLGTGVGSGVIIDGKIVTGVNNAGGECGHMVIVVDGGLHLRQTRLLGGLCIGNSTYQSNKKGYGAISRLRYASTCKGRG